MTKTGLTTDEKLCLQRWFREAIAEVEKREATQFLLREFPIETAQPSHHQPMIRRPLRRAQTTRVTALSY
jgi:hypothetical protein